jgi:hypothetical protein
MTGDDFSRLILYRNKRGPLNPMLRMESGFALVTSAVYNAAGAKKQDRTPFSPSDFMPWAKEPEPEASAEVVFQMISAAAMHNKRGS